MRCTLILALFAHACGGDDGGFSPPPPSPDTSPIGPGDGAGPVGVMDAGDTGDGATAGSATADTGTTAGTLGGSDSGGTLATDGSGTAGVMPCQVQGEACEGDGICVFDPLSPSMYTCSHGGAGEPCIEGMCDEGLFCLLDERSGQFICVPV
jgi:hypothetical protein